MGGNLKPNGFRRSVAEIVSTTRNQAKLAGIRPSLGDQTKVVHVDLHRWDREVLKGKKRINKLKVESENVRSGPVNAESRSRQNWLLHGDQNINFFNQTSTTKKYRNQIKKLLDDTNVWCQGT